MKKKIRLRKTALILLAAAVCISLAGCGKASEKAKTSNDYDYVPEYQSLESEGNLSQIKVIGNTIYYIEDVYDEKTQAHSLYICSLEAGERTPVRTKLDFEKETSISNMCVTPEGNFQLIKVSHGMEADTNHTPLSQKIELCCLAADGTIGQTIDIGGMLSSENDIVQYMEMDKAGNTYLGLDKKIKVIGRDGKERFEVTVSNSINNMFSTKDGTVMLVYDGNEGMNIYPIDVTKKKVGEAEKKLTLTKNGRYIFAAGSDSDLIFSVNDTLSSYNFGDEKPDELLQWMNCNINSDNIQTFKALEEGKILVVSVSHEAESDKIELAYLTKRGNSKIPEKKTLTFGTVSLNPDMNKLILNFNKTNQEYRIELKEYRTDDYYTGLTQFNTALSGGNGPDIIDLSTVNIQKYAVKGILEDLYPYFDSDPEIKREDYLENILKAYEINGRLYSIAPMFSIYTTLAKASEVGNKQHITLDEFITIAERLPEETELMEYATKSFMLYKIVMPSMNRYIDWATGECNFNSEEFIEILEFSNTFKNEFDDRQDSPGTAEKLHEGKLIMVNAVISNVQNYQMFDIMFGEPIAFIGMPTDTDNGSTIRGEGTVLGMNSKSKNKEGVWQFIRFAITKEAQEKTEGSEQWGFPILKTALEAQFESDMKKDYYEDANGNQVEKVKRSTRYDNFQTDVYAATKEQVDVVRKLINSVSTLSYDDKPLYNIIEEETAFFFGGQKSSKDVADIIQSRMQIYVNENR